MLKALSYLYYTGMILIFTGTLMAVTAAEGAAWVFVAGVVPVAGIRLYNRMVSRTENIRLNSILLVSALFLVAAAFFLFTGRNYWILGLLIAAVLDAYTTFRRWK